MSNDTPSKEDEGGWNFAAMQWARDYVRDLNALERGLLLQLAMHSNLSFECFPAQKTLAENFSRDRRTIRTALKSLESKGLISRRRRRSSSTLYTLLVTAEVVREIQERKPTSAPDRKPTSARERKWDALEVATNKEPKEVTILEVLSERTEPSACATGPAPAQQKRGDQGEVFAQNFQKRCRFDPKSRLRFYMDCGRLHTTASHFHKPKNRKKPLTYSQVDALRLWFAELPESGCHVMNYAMANWPRLLDGIPKWRDFRNKTPTISALEKYGAKELLELWQASQRKQVHARVEANLHSVANIQEIAS